MNSYRVHASTQVSDLQTPYLSLGLGTAGNLLLNLDKLETNPEKRVPGLVISTHSLYDVIRGQLVTLSRDGCMVTLYQDGDEVVIEYADDNGRRGYRVWLAEVALGWNMLRDNISTRFHLA